MPQYLPGRHDPDRHGLEMSKVLINALPVGLRYLHYIVVRSALLGMVLRPDPYYYGIMPSSARSWSPSVSVARRSGPRDAHR